MLVDMTEDELEIVPIPLKMIPGEIGISIKREGRSLGPRRG